MNKVFLVILYLFGLFLDCHAQTMNLNVQVIDKEMLFHEMVASGPIPTALDPNAVYPYCSYSETADRPSIKKYKLILLENEFIKATICPDLGGKVLSLIHKESGKEVLYVPEVIRGTRILPRFYFVAGGIEVSFPISHSPSQNEMVSFQIDEDKERIYVSCGERELRFGMHWTVEYSLGPQDDFLTQRMFYKNPGSQPYPWMSWSNAAVPVSEDTEYDFPNGKVLSHSSKIESIDWKTNGKKKESEIHEMTGFFWKTKDVNAFGNFTPSLGIGLYHIADEKIAPGIKLWSYGIDSDREWSMLSTAKRSPYAEIQGGPISDQSIKLELEPNSSRWHVEYWIPTDKKLNLYQINLPRPKLRPIEEIPVFSWARKRDVENWEYLIAAFEHKSSVPLAPEIINLNWPPSGMENLDSCFKWAIVNTKSEQQGLWNFYYGTWLAGRGNQEKAKVVLARCSIGIAKVLLARILHLEGKNDDAAKTIQGIKERWLAIHPQVIVERDNILCAIGKNKLDEREYWLDQVNALDDDWVIERRVQLLIDKGEFDLAKALLLKKTFQKIHQTYNRTTLWMQITDHLKIPFLPIPESLGEDKLATFGAYREYEK